MHFELFIVLIFLYLLQARQGPQLDKRQVQLLQGLGPLVHPPPAVDLPLLDP